MISDLVLDLRLALRSLRRSPGLFVAAIATLALGVGATTAMVSVVRGVLLAPLAYPEEDRVVSILENVPDRGGLWSVSAPNFLDWRANARSITAMAAYSDGSVNSGEGEPEAIESFAVTEDYFRALGVAAKIGRTLGAADFATGAAKAVVVSESYWRRHLGGDPAAVGRTARLDGAPVELVGVVPDWVSSPTRRTEVWMPLVFRADVATQRGAHYLGVVGRLAPGATLETARAELSGVAARLAAAYPDTNEKHGVDLDTVRERVVGGARQSIWVLFAAVVAVALVAAVNVTNLLLARNLARLEELATRVALGASRGRLLRLVVAEGFWLGALGVIAGLPLARLLLTVVLALAPASLPRRGDIRLDFAGGTIALAVALAASMGASLLAASRSARPEFLARLRSGVGPRAGGGRRLRGGLVAAELALAVAVAIAAGLLAKSLLLLSEVDPGFRSSGRLAFQLDLPASRYPHAIEQARFADLALDRLRALHDVEAAEAVMGLPMTDFSFGGTFKVEGDAEEREHGEERIVTPGYFHAAGIPLLAGRVFDERDRRDAPRAVIASESAAKRFFPAGDAIGKRLRFGARPNRDVTMEGEIVGIVGDVRDESLAEVPAPTFYLPMAQTGDAGFSVLVVTRGEPLAALADVRAAIAALDPELPIGNPQSVAHLVASSIAGYRFHFRLLSAFAASALLLAAIGIFGVVDYGLRQRVREFAVRRALGATDRSLLRLVLSEGARWLAPGIAGGLLIAAGAATLLRGMVWGVAPSDPSVFAAGGVLLGAVGAAAAIVAARRTLAVEPATALRSE